MPYYLVADFQAGLDTRKADFSAPAGSLRRCSNAHITRGGEIEKRRALTAYGTLPPGTAGLHMAGDQLFVFGAGPEPSGLPSGIRYQRLTPEGSVAPTPIKRILASANFNGKVYAVAEFENGAIDHYFDGQRVTQWDQVSADIAGLDAVASVLADRLRTDLGLTAVADGTVILVTGSDNEAFTLTSSTANMFVTTEQIAGPTTPQVYRVELTGSFNEYTTYELVVDDEPIRIQGRAAGIGETAYTLQDRVFSTSQSLLRFSGFTDPGTSGGIPQPDPTRWDASGGIGAGFINLSTQDSGSANLTAVASYQGELAVFSRQAVHIRSLAFDVAQMRQLQLLRNLGTSSPRSVVSYGESDVFFLSQSGVRSLRARDSSNAAASADIGTPIDDELAAYTASLDPTALRDAVAEVEPAFGRYLLAIGNRVYVYSQFPGSKISAWSTYETESPISDIAASPERLFMRQGDTVLAYGGTSGKEYDDSSADIVLPHMDLNSPGSTKQITSLDVGCTGTWDVYVRPDPTLPEYEEYLGQIEGATYGLAPSFPLTATGTHVGFRFRSVGDGPATLGQVIIHYQTGDES